MNRSISGLIHRSTIPIVVVRLYSNRIIQQLAASLLGLFVPVFLFQVFQSIQLVLVYYLITYVLYLFLVAPGVKFCGKITFNKGLILSVFGGMLFFIGMYFFELNIWFFALVTIVGSLSDKIFYWVPYHSSFAKFTNLATRGKVLSVYMSFYYLISAISPLIAGFLLAAYGFDILFIIALVIYFSSVFPLIKMQPINEEYSLSYWETWKVLLHKRDRKILYTYMADGAQDFIRIAIWPIFIWLILDGNFVSVGIIASLIVVATILMQVVVGTFADKFNKKTLLKYGSVLYAFGWFIKAFVQNGLHIFAASTYHNFSSIVMRTSFDSLMYEKAADAGHYMDEYSVLRAMSLNLGRILIIIILLVLLNFVSLPVAFIVAALASLFVNLI